MHRHYLLKFLVVLICLSNIASSEKVTKSGMAKPKATTMKKKDGKKMSAEVEMEEEEEESSSIKMVEDMLMSTMSPTEAVIEEGGSKKSVKNFTCQVTGALLSMADSIKELDKDIKAIKNQMFEKCPGFNATDLGEVSSDSEDSTNSTNDETEPEEGASKDPSDMDNEEEDPESHLPPIPSECDQPFQPVASSCYYFLYYPNEWKTWGDANAYCQTLGGTLAAPYRAADLRTYLVENFSNVFWVGAKKSLTTNAFEWLHGQELAKEDWKEGQPSKSAAKFCVYMEYFSGYKAINHYCGEKFSFICEKRAEME